MLDLFTQTNDPVAIIDDAGVHGIFQADLCRKMGWVVTDVIRTLHPLCRVGRVNTHIHGSDHLWYDGQFTGNDVVCARTPR